MPQMVRNLQEELAKATMGQGFLLVAGDCAESLSEFSVDRVRDTFRLILQMALILTFGGAVPVVKVGRMAGLLAKPCSATSKVDGGVELPAYREDNVNCENLTVEARTPDPTSLIKAYQQHAQTQNILRAFAKGGYADISRLHAWNLDFVKKSYPGSQYRDLASKVDESLRFMEAIGVDISSPTFTETNLYTAHECFILPYEQALTRVDSTTGRWYDCSAHMLWIGERSRQLDAAHIEFCRGIENPVGIKISEKCEPSELLDLISTVNPDNIPGRVVAIVRMEAEKLRTYLPVLIRAVQTNGKHVLWVSDPVHGNTVTTSSGRKTCSFEAIRAELTAFFDVHDDIGTHAGGFHVEMTGDDVTECIGGVAGLTEAGDLECCTAHREPRLNGEQSLELAFLVAQRLRQNLGLKPLGE